MAQNLITVQEPPLEKPRSATAASNRNAVWSGIKRDKFLYLLALPGLLYFLLFRYVPMWGVLISFQDYSPYQGFWQSPWVGFEHFQRFFLQPGFSRVIPEYDGD